MTIKLEWTPPRDAVLCRLRAEGATWDTIAAELGISSNGAIERGRRLGARLPAITRAPAAADPNRAPMPAGAPESWGAIIAGSLLTNSQYVWHDPIARNLGAARHAGDPQPTSHPDLQRRH